MPYDPKAIAEALRTIDPALPPAQQAALVKQKLDPSPIEQMWSTVNKPLAGSADALIPQLRHEHSPDEGVIRKTAEDFGAGLTSPLNLGLTATGVGAGIAGKMGKLGISQGARMAEAALQVPLVAEGVNNATKSDASLGERLGGVFEAGLGAHGIHSAATHAFDPTAVRDTYMKEKGLRPAIREPLVSAKAMQTADDYAAMAHAPDDPKVKATYGALANDVKAQHDFLVNRAGVKIEPFSGQGEPYKSSQEMRMDVLHNNHLYYLPTDQGVTANLPVDHPMLKDSPHGPLNDQFRAVHDYFGHAVEGSGFGPKGEQQAFNAHRDTISPDAVPALATETKGQNSFVNFGPHMRNAEGGLIEKGQPGYLPLPERPFAEQKANILPQYHAPDPAVVARLTDSPPLPAELKVKLDQVKAATANTARLQGRQLDPAMIDANVRKALKAWVTNPLQRQQFEAAYKAGAH